MIISMSGEKIEDLETLIYQHHMRPSIKEEK